MGRSADQQFLPCVEHAVKRDSARAGVAECVRVEGEEGFVGVHRGIMAKVKVISEPWHIHGRDVVCFEIEFIEGTIAVGMKMALPQILRMVKRQRLQGLSICIKLPAPTGGESV